MIRVALEDGLRSALGKLGVAAPDVVVLERPARREHGEWSSNVALATARAAGRNPRELAGQIADLLNASPPPHVTAVDVAGPGFVNFSLAPSWLHDVLRDVVAGGESDYGRLDIGTGERVMIEFVSANPTGPIHVGNGWFASYGDSLARILQRCGYTVTREYYVNDTGGQIRRLGESLLARRAGAPLPDGGYPSGFVKGLASAYDGPDDIDAAGRWAAERILRFIQVQLASVHIVYDEWFSQASIEESAAVAETIDLLAAKGLVFEEDGALWLDTARFGDPRERRVLRKSPDQGGDYTDLVDDIGSDVMRLLSLVASIDQAAKIDLDQVRAESKESPAYYIQYAHARIHSIGKRAGELGVERADLGGVDLAPLTHERELDLLRTLSTLPDVIELACAERAPHKVTTWVRELADRFHGFYHDCRVLGDDVPPGTTQARLWLVEASRIGFAVGLDLLGVAAPESM
jgi:arginyl-tRNA synthetase